MAARKDSAVVYTLVAKGDLVLVQFTNYAGTFRHICQVLLRVIEPSQIFTTYGYETYLFHVLSDGGYTYACLSTSKFPQQLAFDLLEEIKTQFVHDHATSKSSALPLEMNRRFLPFMRETVFRFNSVDQQELLDSHDLHHQNTAARPGLSKLDVAQLARRDRGHSALPPLLVQQIIGGNIAKRKRARARQLTWARAHPFTFVAFSFLFVFLGFYLFMVVPQCGWLLDKEDPKTGQQLCWGLHKKTSS